MTKQKNLEVQIKKMRKNNHRCVNCGHIKVKHNERGKCQVRNCRCKIFLDSLSEVSK